MAQRTLAPFDKLAEGLQLSIRNFVAGKLVGGFGQGGGPEFWQKLLDEKAWEKTPVVYISPRTAETDRAAEENHACLKKLFLEDAVNLSRRYGMTEAEKAAERAAISDAQSRGDFSHQPEHIDTAALVEWLHRFVAQHPDLLAQALKEHPLPEPEHRARVIHERGQISPDSPARKRSIEDIAAGLKSNPGPKGRTP